MLGVGLGEGEGVCVVEGVGDGEGVGIGVGVGSGDGLGESVGVAVGVRFESSIAKYTVLTYDRYFGSWVFWFKPSKEIVKQCEPSGNSGKLTIPAPPVTTCNPGLSTFKGTRPLHIPSIS